MPALPSSLVTSLLYGFSLLLTIPNGESGLHGSDCGATNWLESFEIAHPGNQDTKTPQAFNELSSRLIIAWLIDFIVLSTSPTGTNAGSHEKRLLHHLLDTYNVLERPVANESDPLQLSFGLTLMQIIDVVSSQEPPFPGHLLMWVTLI